MRTSDAINELVAALTKARVTFAPIKKTAKGQITNQRAYDYAPLENIIDATDAALAAEGLVVFQAIEAETSTLITRLAHTSGQWVESVYPLHSYERPQEFGSQLSYGRRYSLSALLNVAAEEDEDAEAATTTAPSKTFAPAAVRASQPPAASAAPAAPAAPSLAGALFVKEIRPEALTRKDGSPVVNKNGEPMTRYYIVIGNDAVGVTLQTLSERLCDAAQDAKDRGVPVEYDEAPSEYSEFHELKKLRLVPAAPATPKPAPKASKPKAAPAPAPADDDGPFDAPRPPLDLYEER